MTVEGDANAANRHFRPRRHLVLLGDRGCGDEAGDGGVGGKVRVSAGDGELRSGVSVGGGEGFNYSVANNF